MVLEKPGMRWMTYRCPPSTGLPGCLRPASGPFKLTFDFIGGLEAVVFCAIELLTGLPDALFAGGMELNVEAILKVSLNVRVVKLCTTGSP